MCYCAGEDSPAELPAQPNDGDGPHRVLQHVGHTAGSVPHHHMDHGAQVCGREEVVTGRAHCTLQSQHPGILHDATGAAKNIPGEIFFFTTAALLQVQKF